MDRETMRLAILSATEEWRQDAERADGVRGPVRPGRPGDIGRARAKKSLRRQAKEILSGEKAGGEKRSHGNTRLPYGLCKKYGIEVPPGTTPYEAWELLKGKGVNPQEEYRKLKERGERAQEKAKREARKAAGEQSPQKGKEGPSEAAGKGKEAGKKAGGKTPATARPGPERVEPKRFRSAREASEYLEDRCNVVITASWEKGVCASAKKEIAGTVAALEERYGALDREHNFGWPVEFADGKGPKLRDIAGMDYYPYSGYQTARLCFFSGYFSSEEDLEDTRSKVRGGKDAETGFYMPSEDGMEIAFLAAHEYGHCVEYRILRDKGVIGDDPYHDPTERIKDEILRIAKEIEPGCEPEKLIENGGLISRYGSKNPRDFFAECFANSVCGEPNVLGRAMAIYLDRCGIGRAQ